MRYDDTKIIVHVDSLSSFIHSELVGEKQYSTIKMSVSLVEVSRFYGSTLSNKKERSEVTNSNISPKKVSDMRKRSEVTARVWIGPGFPKKMSEKRKRSGVTDSHISSKKVSDKEKNLK